MIVYTAALEIDQHILDEMNKILARETGLEDTKEGNIIQTFYADFPINNFQVDIKVCNGSKDSSPWIDCVLFDEKGNELACFVGEGETLQGEYQFHYIEDKYNVIVKAKPEHRCVALVGNISEGFKVVGPFPDFDTAAEEFPGPDVWIMGLEHP